MLHAQKARFWSQVWAPGLAICRACIACSAHVEAHISRLQYAAWVRQYLLREVHPKCNSTDLSSLHVNLEQNASGD